jgi:hypothetical protein
MEWISVNDRLPKYSGNYLVYSDDKIKIIYFDSMDFNTSYFFPVYYWMPLPNPPEQ